MADRTFFPSYTAYRTWIRTIPHIILCHPEEVTPILSRLRRHDPVLPDLRGPYYLQPAFLVLQVGWEYRVLRRVLNEQEADVCWLHPNQELHHGAYVYAAYITGEDGKPLSAPTLLGAGDALRKAQAQARITRRLRP